MSENITWKMDFESGGSCDIRHNAVASCNFRRWGHRCIGDRLALIVVHTKSEESDYVALLVVHTQHMRRYGVYKCRVLE